MTDTDNAARIVEKLAREAAEAQRLVPGSVYGYPDASGILRVVNLQGDEYLDWPARKRGTVTVRNVASFRQYYEKHHDDASEVFADLDAGTVTAVLDAHGTYTQGGGGEDGARWQTHRLILALQLTQPWKDWTAQDRKFMGQEAFAEFLEEHASDVDGSGKVKTMDLYEAAQHFKATLKVNVKSAKRLQDGQTQFEYTEEIQSAGRPGAGNGTIEMPNEFDLAIRPYEDAVARPVAVKLRYRIGDGGRLALGYFMNEPARVAREAVAEVVAKLAEECSVTVMHGQPA